MEERAEKGTAGPRLRRIAIATSLLAASLGSLPSAAPAGTVIFDTARMGTTQVIPSLSQCGLMFSGTELGNSANLVLGNSFGLGLGTFTVLGDGDVLTVDFPAEVVGVVYTLTGAVDVDMDGFVAETMLSGFDSGGGLVAQALVSGAGPIDVSASLGDAAIASLEIAPQADDFRLTTVEYSAFDPVVVPLDLQTLGQSFRTPASYSLCGFTLSAVDAGATMTIDPNSGMGVQTPGVTGTFLTTGERFEIDLPAPSTGVDIRIGAPTAGALRLIAIDSEGMSSRAATLNFPSGTGNWTAVSSLFPSTPEIATLSVEVDSGSLWMTGVRAAPEPAPALLGPAALAALAALRKRRGAVPSV